MPEVIQRLYHFYRVYHIRNMNESDFNLKMTL